MVVIGVICFLILLALEGYLMYEFMKDYDNIPTSIYYKKISRLQKEIESLVEKRKRLNPMKAGFDNMIANIDTSIKAKKKEIKRVKIHIRIEDDSNKY